VTKYDLVREYVAEHPELSQRAVARALGVSQTTVQYALHPERLVEMNAKRAAAKRAWENAQRATCSRCGAAMGAGTLRADGSSRRLAGELCATCRGDDRVVRVLEMAKLRRVDDLTDAQIAERVGCAKLTVRQELCRLRAIGFDVPLAPYARCRGRKPHAAMTRDAEILRRTLAERGITIPREPVAA
jgi:predicted ArsR family transcriptional regulator